MFQSVRSTENDRPSIRDTQIVIDTKMAIVYQVIKVKNGDSSRRTLKPLLKK